MTSRQRVAAAMRHAPVDRVPWMCQLALGHYFLNFGQRYQPHEIWFSSEAFADVLVEAAQRYRFDGVLINIPGRPDDLHTGIPHIEATPDGELLTWKNGLRVLVPPDDNPLLEPDDTERAPHASFADFDPERDFERLGAWPRYIWGVYHVPELPGESGELLAQIPPYFLRTIDLVKRRVGESLSIHGEVFSPFTHLLELFGYQDAMLALAMDPPKVERILDRLADAVIAWGRAQAERGVDAVLISSAFAGAGFISPDMYRRFVLPCERKVVDALHATHPGVPVYTHTCGRLADRLELLAETHTDGVDTLDPPPLGDCDLADAKRRVGARLFIKGNMNAVALLSDSADQLRARALAALEAGRPGGGYILSTACSVAPRVEPWKLELLADVAIAHGREKE